MSNQHDEWLLRTAGWERTSDGDDPEFVFWSHADQSAKPDGWYNTPDALTHPITDRALRHYLFTKGPVLTWYRKDFSVVNVELRGWSIIGSGDTENEALRAACIAYALATGEIE